MSETQKESGFFSQVMRGAGIAVTVTLVGLLLFALVVYLTGLSDAVIKPVNQFIKVLSVFLGCFCALKGKGGFVKGALTGFVAALLTYLIFSIISGNFIFDYTVILDLIFCAVSGLICGILAVNFKKPD